MYTTTTTGLLTSSWSHLKPEVLATLDAIASLLLTQGENHMIVFKPDWKETKKASSSYSGSFSGEVNSQTMPSCVMPGGGVMKQCLGSPGNLTFLNELNSPLLQFLAMSHNFFMGNFPLADFPELVESFLWSTTLSAELQFCYSDIDSDMNFQQLK